MLVELSVVEQRYLAVPEVLVSGARIKDVAIRYSSQTPKNRNGNALGPPESFILFRRRRSP
jgi:hypothetical protein